MALTRAREHDDASSERSSKRPRMDGVEHITIAEEDLVSSGSTWELSNLLPPSHALLGVTHQTASDGSQFRLMEADVGVSEYISRGVSKIEGIIKQRSVTHSS
jgi:tRNA pseudouridine13 synthase